MSVLVLFSVVWADAPAALDCQPCHEEIYTQWRGSRHAVSASNPVFRASWENWANGWCLDCHAPRPAQQVSLLGHVASPGVVQVIPELPPGLLWQDGVDCLACHGSESGIRTAGTASIAALAMHDLVEDPTFSTEAMCARCHEFPFQLHSPRMPFTFGEVLAQSTVTEWRSSPAFRAGRTCQDCHMGAQGHGFPGAHAESFVRDALGVQVERRGHQLVFRVDARESGHAVPTGDPFRRLELWLCVERSCAEPTVVAWFKRTLVRTDTSWDIDRDLRIPATGSREVTVVPPAGATAWQLVYRYGERRFEHELPAAEVGYALARGVIPLE